MHDPGHRVRVGRIVHREARATVLEREIDDVAKVRQRDRDDVGTRDHDARAVVSSSSRMERIIRRSPASSTVSSSPEPLRSSSSTTGCLASSGSATCRRVEQFERRASTRRWAARFERAESGALDATTDERTGDQRREHDGRDDRERSPRPDVGSGTAIPTMTAARIPMTARRGGSSAAVR
jgi:hypothetical protein